MRHRLGSLFSPAMFVALLALMISLSSASVAAVVIHGKQIKKNTVTSAQIKNKTIKTKDVSLKARNQLKGKTGATGAPGIDGAPGVDGAPGSAGPAGPVGPSNAYTKFVSAPTVYGSPATSSEVLSLSNLPAGSYVVNTKAWAVGKNTNAYVNCDLAVGTATDSSGADMAKNEAYASVANQITFTSTAPATVALTCKGRDAHVQHKRITAIKVGSIS